MTREKWTDTGKSNQLITALLACLPLTVDPHGEEDDADHSDCDHDGNDEPRPHYGVDRLHHSSHGWLLHLCGLGDKEGQEASS